MKKLFISAIVALAAFTGALAQTKSSNTTSAPKLSVGLDFGLPTGNWSNGYSIGFGGSGKAEFPLSKSFNLTLTTGYINYHTKDGFKDALERINYKTYFGYIPVKAGGKLFLSEIFYADAEIGVLFGINNNSGNLFIYAPGLGVSFPVSDNHDIDFGARYEGWSQSGGNIGQVAFRIAYKFGL